MIKLYLSFVLSGACLSAPHHESTYHLPIPHPAPLKQPSVFCTTQYATVWDTEYKETETQVCTTEYDKECKTEYQTLCLNTVRTECQTVYESKCETIYNKVCLEQYRTEYEPFTESECTTQYKKDCEYRWEGEGNSKIWAPIPDTCKENPYDECKVVPKTKEKQVAYPVCSQVPQEVCVDVPSQACRDIPDNKCVDQPYETCQDIPRENCHNEHKKVPIRVSRKIPKQVCIHTDGYTENKSAHTVLPIHAAVPAGVIPPPAEPTQATPTVILPTVVERKDRIFIEDDMELENAEVDVGASKKLVADHKESKEEPNKKPIAKDAVVFKNYV